MTAILLAACTNAPGASVFTLDATVPDVPAMDVPGTDAPGTDAASQGDAGDADTAVTDTSTGLDVGCTDGGTSCGGLCVNTATDPRDCGRCGNACTASQLCRVGTCVINPCPHNQYPCDLPDASETCTDLSSDVANCGACGATCAAGMECSAGMCFAHCTAPQVRCGAACATLATDPGNCGACGHACSAGQTCAGNTCTCAAPLVACGGGCISTATDVNNCGSCGHACPAAGVCVGGTCMGCFAPRTLCGTGVCADTSSDAAHCGGCGTACHGAEVCVAGACSCAGTAGLMVCGGACADVQTDPANCGSCGHACPAGASCSGGTCAVTTHYRLVSNPPGVSFIDACGAPGAMTYLAGENDGSALVPLTFAFRYWSTDLTAGALVNICSNGWLGMDGMVNNAFLGMIPSPAPPNAVIAPHWGDGYNGTPGQCVATVGAAPGRKWVAEWSDDYYCCSRGPVSLTYEVILSETSNAIDMVYGTMTGARAQVLGIENFTGSMGLSGCPGGTQTCTPATGQVTRFLPIP